MTKRSSRVRGWLRVVVGVVVWGPLAGQVWAENRLPAATQVERVVTLTSGDREDEFPAITCDGDGNVWVCWVGWDGQSDAVYVRRVDGENGGEGQAPFLAEGRPGEKRSQSLGDCWRPVMCTDGDGRVWVTWAQNEGGHWDIWGKFLVASVGHPRRPGKRSGEDGARAPARSRPRVPIAIGMPHEDGKPVGTWSQAIRMTKSAGNDFCQQLAVDSAGKVWMVWQSVVEKNYEILLARVTPKGLRDVRNVSEHPANDWEPAIATTKDGRIFIGWDSYRKGSYDVLVREFREGRLGETIGVATSGDYEAHAALAVDRQNRLWAAWDNGGPGWGESNQSRRRLHSQRSVGILCLQSGGSVPKQDPADILKNSLGRFCELPELIVDGEGRLWLFVRHLTDLTPKGRRKNGRPYQSRGIWNFYALCYADGVWSEPVKLPDSNGRNDMRPATCVDEQGRVWAAWADDGRRDKRAEEPVNHNVHVGMMRGPELEEVGLPAATARPRPRAAVLHPASRPGAAVLHEDGEPAAGGDRTGAPKRHTLIVGGKTYRLLYGDTHRHTDISRCAMNYDGSLMDTYRYAIDVAGLDFLAISDHDQDILKHRYNRKKRLLPDYAWWRSQKYCDLFTIEGKFLPIYGYEHGGSFAKRGGHKNVLYLNRGNPCYEEDSPEALFGVLKGKEAVVIPHQLADGPARTDWTKWDSAFERVAEIYQARGSYERMNGLPGVRVSYKGHFYWDALEAGVRIGVVASSDHGLVSNAYAGVYCAEFSRRGILEGIRSRRTFGATDRMVIDFRLGENVLGQEVEVGAAPGFQVYVRGTGVLTKVQIVKDSRFIHTITPGRIECRFRYIDRDSGPGSSSYYYVRCEQENGQYGWSSPIWVSRSGSQ